MISQPWGLCTELEINAMLHVNLFIIDVSILSRLLSVVLLQKLTLFYTLHEPLLDDNPICRIIPIRPFRIPGAH